jgi:hypothetical protein
MNEATNWRVIVLQILILLAIAFGALAWANRPDGALVWLVGMLSMPLAWLLVVAFGAMPGEDRPKERRSVLNSLIGASLMITGALGACALGTLGAIEEEWITRYGMVVVALSLVITGNGLPKKADGCSGGSRDLAIKRLLGWNFVITGAALIIAWLLLPMANDVVWWATAAIYAGMIGVGVVGVARIRARRSSAA